jgi:multidrug efflux system membrane fusion protein
MRGRSWLGLVLVLCWGLLPGCSGQEQQTYRPAVPVAVGRAVSGDVPYEVSAFGHVEAYRTVAVTAQVGGVLQKVFFSEGQTVQAGEPLFLIDPAPYHAALSAAEAKLAGDRATAANLAESLKRYDNLAQKDYITAQQHSDMVAQLASARAAVRADSAQVANARLDLQYCSIVAPIGGRLGAQLVNEGNVVRDNADDPLTVINQIQPIYVRFTVPEQYLPDLLRETRQRTLEVRASSPAEPPNSHVGRLTFVDNSVDVTTGTIMLKAEFANQDESLWPGEFVKVVLVLQELRSAIIVPAQAVGTGQQGDFLFVVRPDSTVEVRLVRVTYRFDHRAVIGTGVQAGETVVTDGQLRLQPGTRVTVRAPVAAAPAGEDTTEQAVPAGARQMTGPADTTGAGEILAPPVIGTADTTDRPGAP